MGLAYGFYFDWNQKTTRLQSNVFSIGGGGEWELKVGW